MCNVFALLCTKTNYFAVVRSMALDRDGVCVCVCVRTLHSCTVYMVVRCTPAVHSSINQDHQIEAMEK